MVLVGLLLVNPSRAYAQASTDDEARGLYAAGTAAFTAGRYEEALGYFQHAYDLSHRAAMLYNIGQAADRARRDQVALDAFERYLAGVPEISNRAEIEGRVRVLRAALAERAAASAVTPEPVEAQPVEVEPVRAEPAPVPETAPVMAPSQVVPPSAGVDAGAVVLVAAGGVSAVAGAIMVGIGAPDIDGPREGEIYANGVARQERASVLVGVGSPMLGLGVVAAVVGIVLLATSSQPGPVAVRPDGFEVMF
jgi:tetratricopeptide (TPR) repeat protein